MPSADELKKKDRIISFYHLCYRIERERLLLGMKGDLNYEFPKRKEPLCKSSSTPGSPGSTTAGPNHRLPFPYY